MRRYARKNKRTYIVISDEEQNGGIIMKYRKFGKLDIELSAFGVGCMRLPIVGDDKTKIDEAEAIKMIRRAIDGGVTYVDTAYPYHGGNSEYVVGKALKDGYRERVHLATKLPIWLCEKPEDLQKYFDEQLSKLQTDHIDFYLVHALSKERWDNAKKLGITDFLTKLKNEGKIKYACFSFHDKYEVFEEIINDYDWDMCQIQYNFMDINNQAGTKGLELAGSKGIPVVIMEGLLGGRLAKAPANVQKLYDEFETKRSPVEWAFRWLCNHPEVATVLSGVSNMEQVEDNLRIFDTVEVGAMDEKELKLMSDVRDAYNSLIKVPCTACQYCMPCPNGVDIPKTFAVWNNASLYDGKEKGHENFEAMVKEGKDPRQCVACGACEAVCPQHINIIEMLKKATEEIG